MPTLTYWLTRSAGGTILRCNTEAHMVQILEDYSEKWHTEFEAPQRVSVEYKNEFDLLCRCLRDGTRPEWEQ